MNAINTSEQLSTKEIQSLDSAHFIHPFTTVTWPPVARG